MVWRHLFNLIEIVTKKDCFSCFIWILKVWLRLKIIQKGGLGPLRLLPLRTEFSVFKSLQGIVSEIGWLGGDFLVGLQNYMENKIEGNDNKLILWDFNCTMDKIKRSGQNKAIYICRFIYALSKIIVDNGLEDLRGRDNPYYFLFILYNRSSGTTSRIDRVYFDKNIASNTKINHIIVSFTDHLMLFFLTDSPQKLRMQKISLLK